MGRAVVVVILVAAVVVVVVIGPNSFAQTTTPSTAPSNVVEPLIAQLASEDWATRQAAQDKLVALGAVAVERLQRAARESPDDEVRQRAESALVLIAQDEQIGPSIITLHLKNATVRNAFAELSRQARTNLQPMPAELWDLRPWPTVTLDVDGKPFWLALRELCDATGIELRQWSDGLRLMQGAGGGGAPGWTTGRTAVCGAFLVTLRQCTRTQTVEYTPTGDTRSSDFSLAFQATAEPKLRVLRSSYMAKLEEATDDAGNSLLPPVPVAGEQEASADQSFEPVFVPGPGGSWQFSARLLYPPQGARLGRKIKALRGNVSVMLQTGAQAIEIGNVLSAQNQTRSAGGLKLTLTNLKKAGERYELAAVIARDRAAMPRDADWQQVQQSVNDIRLLDDQGRPFAGSTMGSGGTDDALEVTMSFVRDESAAAAGAGVVVAPAAAALNLNPPPNVGAAAAAAAVRGAAAGASSGEPSKLVWQVPTEVKEVTIPFEFNDVPLPE